MEQEVALKKPKSRILALDILRGITVAGMIMVNNPGSWGAIYAPLEHASWLGLTPTDLVFPFFMFIMGISTYISMRKYQFEYSHATKLGFICAVEYSSRGVPWLFCISVHPWNF